MSSINMEVSFLKIHFIQSNRWVLWSKMEYMLYNSREFFLFTELHKCKTIQTKALTLAVHDTSLREWKMANFKTFSLKDSSSLIINSKCLC